MSIKDSGIPYLLGQAVWVDNWTFVVRVILVELAVPQNDLVVFVAAPSIAGDPGPIPKHRPSAATPQSDPRNLLGETKTHSPVLDPEIKNFKLGIFPTKHLIPESLKFSHSHRIHVWHSCLHLVDFYGINVGKYTIVPWILWG